MKNATELREKAASLREVAETVNGSDMRRQYLEIADQYDKLARDSERERGLSRHARALIESLA